MASLQMGAPGPTVTAAARAQVETTDLAILGDQANQIKAMLIARAARAGVTVHESFGGYIVGQGVMHEVPDLRMLYENDARLLEQFGA